MSNSGFGEFAREVREIEHLVARADEISWKEDYTQSARPVDVLLYLGCNILRTAHLAQEAVELFRAIGADFEAVAGPQFCCGIVHHREGNTEAGERLALATEAKLRSFGARQVAIWCPTCFLRYEDLANRRVLSGIPAISAVEYLAAQADRLPPLGEVRARAVLHCHSGAIRSEADAAAAARLLVAIPGVELLGTIASPDLDYHCPAGLARVGRSRFRGIRGELIEKARSLGADTILTLYHSCHRLWSDVQGDSPRIRNYVSLLAEALGRSHQDRYQELARPADPDAASLLSRPQWESHGLTEEAARLALARHFPRDEGDT